MQLSLVVFRGMPLIENVHPLQGGYLRRKVRRTRRPASARDSALLFHVRHWTNTLVKCARLVGLVWRVNQIRRRVLREHPLSGYTDIAIAKLPQNAADGLEMEQEHRVWKWCSSADGMMILCLRRASRWKPPGADVGFRVTAVMTE
jgi:hypothetical protein